MNHQAAFHLYTGWRGINVSPKHAEAIVKAQLQTPQDGDAQLALRIAIYEALRDLDIDADKAKAVASLF